MYHKRADLAMKVSCTLTIQLHTYCTANTKQKYTANKHFHKKILHG